MHSSIFISRVSSPHGRNEGWDSDGLGNSYPTLWKASLMKADESWIRRSCFIPQSVSLNFDEEQTGTVEVPRRMRYASTKPCLELVSGFLSQELFENYSVISTWLLIRLCRTVRGLLCLRGPMATRSWGETLPNCSGVFEGVSAHQES